MYSSVVKYGAGAAASDENSEIDTLRENYSWQIPVHHSNFKILKNYESELCQVLQDKFGCVSTLISPVLENHTNSLQVFRKVLTSGIEVSVWKGDLTRHVADAVVNAANEQLEHVGGLALALLRAGGPEIEEDSRSHIGRYGRVTTGKIAVTRAGRLPCKSLIHAVGPQWTAEDGRRCVAELQAAIEHILNYVNFQALHIKSVAIPAISSGIFRFPLDLCTKTIVETIHSYFQSRLALGNFKEIHLVSNEDPTVAAFKTAAEYILGKNELKSLALDAEKTTSGSLLSSLSDFLWTKEKKENGPKANSPAINLMGSNKEEMSEAREWIHRLLNLEGHHTIENNHIFYLGVKEHDILSQLQETANVSISETINSGKAKLEIKGAQAGLIEVVMKIEHMLCDIQEEMAKKREEDLWKALGQWTDKQPKDLDEMRGNISLIKCPVTFSTQELQDKKKQFEKCGFHVIKVEKINNEVLSTVFQAKKKTLEEKAPKEPVSHMLFQQVPYQFCNVVCRTGFQRMYQMPCDSKYGAGIYFTKNLKNLAAQIKKTPATDKLIYVFEAEVLTGSFCQGCELNIVPPPLSPGSLDSHDSVVDSVLSPDTFVIFSGMQAMPQYLWTCTQD